MEVGLPPSMAMNSGVFQRETRKLQCEGFEGSRWDIVRRVVLKVGSVMFDAGIADEGRYDCVVAVVRVKMAVRLIACLLGRDVGG